MPGGVLGTRRSPSHPPCAEDAHRRSGTTPETFRDESVGSEFVPKLFRIKGNGLQSRRSARVTEGGSHGGIPRRSRSRPAAVPRRSLRSRFAPELLPDRSTEAVPAGRGPGSQNRVLGCRFRFGGSVLGSDVRVAYIDWGTYTGRCTSTHRRHHRSQPITPRHTPLVHHDRSRTASRTHTTRVMARSCRRARWLARCSVARRSH